MPLRPVLRGALAALLLGVGPACAGRQGDGAVEVRFWALGREGEVAQQMLRDFERENPGIRVRVQQIPWTAAHEKLLTAFVGDATPDLAQIGNTWIPEFTALGALAPLDSLAAASRAVDSSGYFPGIWATNVIGARLYGAPWYVDTRVIFYRKDLLAAAGYATMPTTWSEWRAALAAVQRRAKPGQHAIFLPTNEWMQPVLFGVQAGSPLLKDGGRYGAFGDSAFRRGFDAYVSLFRDGYAPVASTNDVANVFQEFARGTFTMWITGPWNIGEMRRRLPPELQDAWGTAPLPGPSGAASGLSNAGGSSLALFRNSAHPAEAWKVVEFLSRPEQQLRFYALTGDLPARREAWRAPVLANDPYARAFGEQLQHVAPMPKVPEWELIATKVQDYAEAVIRGGRPSGEALAALDREVDHILEKRRWLMAQGALAGAGEPAR